MRLLQMAQQDQKCTSPAKDCQSNCFYPIALLALLTLFSPCWTATDCQTNRCYRIAVLALLTLFAPFLQIAQQNQEKASIAADCQSNCCCPIAMVALLAFSMQVLQMAQHATGSDGPAKPGRHKSCNRMSVHLLLSNCYGDTVYFAFPLLDFPCSLDCPNSNLDEAQQTLSPVGFLDNVSDICRSALHFPNHSKTPENPENQLHQRPR